MASASLQTVRRLKCLLGEFVAISSAIHRLPVYNSSVWSRGWRPFTSSVASEESRKQEDTPSQSQVSEDLNDEKLKIELEKLNKDLTLQAEKTKELDGKYKRALADSENLRKRMMKQIDDAKLFGIQGFCKDLLEVADILGKATESVPQEQLNDNNPHLKSLYEGLKMTEAHLMKVFKRHGLEQVNPLNEKFNPNFHEALFQQEAQDKEPGTVVVVSKIGYKLHERVVRPALVGVAKLQ